MWLHSIIDARAAQHVYDALNEDPSKVSDGSASFWAEIQKATIEVYPETAPDSA